jgi:hypothetical protein
MTPRLRRSNIVLAAGLALFIGGIYSYTYSKMKTVRAACGRKSDGARAYGASHVCKVYRSTCDGKLDSFLGLPGAGSWVVRPLLRPLPIADHAAGFAHLTNSAAYLCLQSELADVSAQMDDARRVRAPVAAAGTAGAGAPGTASAASTAGKR